MTQDFIDPESWKSVGKNIVGFAQAPMTGTIDFFRTRSALEISRFLIGGAMGGMFSGCSPLAIAKGSAVGYSIGSAVTRLDLFNTFKEWFIRAGVSEKIASTSSLVLIAALTFLVGQGINHGLSALTHGGVQSAIILLSNLASLLFLSAILHSSKVAFHSAQARARSQVSLSSFISSMKICLDLPDR